MTGVIKANNLIVIFSFTSLNPMKHGNMKTLSRGKGNKLPKDILSTYQSKIFKLICLMAHINLVYVFVSSI